MTATLGHPGQAAEDLELQDVPRKITKPISRGDRVFRAVLRAGGIAVLVITGLIAIFLVVKASSALRLAGSGFFTHSTWIPSGNRFGIATSCRTASSSP